MNFKIFDLERLYKNGYRWIAIDLDGSICAFTVEPAPMTNNSEWDYQQSPSLQQCREDIIFLLDTSYTARNEGWKKELYELVKE